MKPRVHKLNAHRSFEYYTPEDVAELLRQNAEMKSVLDMAAPQPQGAIPKATRDEWRAQRDEAMVSAIGEYTPREFWELLDAYEALLAAPQPQAAGDWVMVPREPTPTMCAAGFVVSEAEHDPAGVYRAMLAAALNAQPQASAEDVALVALWCEGIEEVEAAFERICASLGVVK